MKARGGIASSLTWLHELNRDHVVPSRSTRNRGTVKLAEQIVQQLIEAGIHRIYGIVGDSLNPIVDAVRATGGAKKGGIDWVHVRHEEAAAFAAGAEAQLTGELAVCAGSCGPGNLHLINGLFDANRSKAPVLAIASQIPSVQIGQGYFQETHPERLYEECSVYNELISTTDQAPRVLASAIRYAVGKSGVSVVTLPGDLADEDSSAEAPKIGTLRRSPKVPSLCPTTPSARCFSLPRAGVCPLAHIVSCAISEGLAQWPSGPVAPGRDCVVSAGSWQENLNSQEAS